MRLGGLERLASIRFGMPVTLTCSDGRLTADCLNPAEQARYRAIRHAQRRRDWLLGRGALKKLLAALDRSVDTSALSFPHPQLSLTHAGRIAVAAGTNAPSVGMGVDYEPRHPIAAGVERWFLNDVESAWLRAQPEASRTDHIIRLWTVKEAAFKSHPDNASIALVELSIANPGTSITEVASGNVRSYVLSHAFAAGYLSVSINRKSS